MNATPSDRTPTAPTADSAEALGRDLPDRADVVVIGGGIAGACATWHLARLGVDVALIEKDRIGGGATGSAVGVLSPPVRQAFHETANDRGPEAARDLWAFASRSTRGLAEALRELGEAERAELDLTGGWLLAEPHTAHQVEASFRSLERAEVDVRWADAGEVGRTTGGRGFTGGFKIEGGGAVAARPAARALARGAAEAGARLTEGTAVDEVLRGEDGAFRCVCGSREVRCEIVVYATHVESRRFSQLLGDEIVPIRGQAMALRLERPFPSGGGFSSHWKLNVWRRDPGSETTVYLGGWRHDAWDRAYGKARPQIDDRLQRDLVAWFSHAFRDLGEPEVTARWSGIFGWTADYLPIVGALPGTPDELVLAGFSGGGLPFAFESGRVVAHAVAGRDPVEGAAMFSPRRFL